MDPYIQSGAERQSQIEAAKAAFFMSGGSVRECGLSETAPVRASVWNTSITQRKDARREYERLESTYAGLIRDHSMVETVMGSVGRTSIEVRNKLRTLGVKLTTPQVEQIAARHLIQLKDDGRGRL